MKVMLKTVFLTSLIFTVPIVGARWFGWFEASELSAYDDFIRRRPEEKPDDRIVIVTVGDEDLESLQQYPLHDDTFAKALEKLEDYKPRAIGLDIARDIPHGAIAGRKQLTQLIAKNKTIVSGCLLSTQNHPGSPPAPGTPEGGAAFTDVPPDSDQVVRRVRLISTPEKTEKPIRTKHVCNESNGAEIPSLSFLLAQLYLAESGINPEPNVKGDIQFGKRFLNRIDANFGSYAHADVNDYQMILNYRGAKNSFQEIPISHILQNKVDAQVIRDRVVLIGSSSEVSKDFLATPYIQTQLGARNMNGVVIHAHAVSQILSAVLDQRPLIQSWSEPGEVLWIWVWSLGSGLMAFYNRRLGLFLIGVMITGVALWGICYGLFIIQGLWIPLVPTLMTAMLTALSVRVVDLAARSGYAQAFYEQLQEQIRGGAVGRDRRGDYLESLVQRARVARQGQDAAALLTLDPTPDDDLATETSPTMKALYEKVSQQVRQEMEAERLAQQTVIRQSASTAKQGTRLKTLLTRSQQSRTHLLGKPEVPPTDQNSPFN